MIHTHNAFRLGDNLVQLNFLRRACLADSSLEIAHYHNPQLCKLEEIEPLCLDLGKRLVIRPIDQASPESVDSWRNIGGWWERHPLRLNFAAFHLQWFEELAKRLGIPNPIHSASDLLLDYPALDSEIPQAPECDVLVVNSPGLSGQFLNFNPDDYRDLIARLILKGHRVISTAPTGLCPTFENKTTTFIGATSTRAKIIVGTSTGPSWTCLNVHNQAKPIILCADHEEVVLTPNTRMAKSVHHAIHILQRDGVL